MSRKRIKNDVITTNKFLKDVAMIMFKHLLIFCSLMIVVTVQTSGQSGSFGDVASLENKFRSTAPPDAICVRNDLSVNCLRPKSTTLLKMQLINNGAAIRVDIRSIAVMPLERSREDRRRWQEDQEFFFGMEKREYIKGISKFFEPFGVSEADMNPPCRLMEFSIIESYILTCTESQSGDLTMALWRCIPDWSDVPGWSSIPRKDRISRTCK